MSDDAHAMTRGTETTEALDPAPVPAAGGPGDHQAARRAAWVAPFVAVSMFLAALNLRPAIGSLGALLEEVRDGLHMSGSVAGVLTSVPPLCFAVFGFAAPRLARRYGPGAIVCAGLAAVTAGLLIRPFVPSTVPFLLASALALAGIAVSNVLMPVIVKRYFPDRVGTMTGLYSMALSLGTAGSAAAAVPLAHALGGWRSGLAAWGVLAAVALVPWLVLVRDRSGYGEKAAGKEAGGASAGPARDVLPSLLRSRTAWSLAVFFGLQATGAYITMGWMSQRFRDAGVSAGTAGVLLAVIMVMGVPLAFVIPGLATRLSHQGPIVVVLCVCGLVAIGGLYAAPVGGAWVWAVLLGVSNCSFPLALTMIGMRSSSGQGVVRLSAFAQCTGYLISIPGPLLVGVLYQHSGGWTWPLALMGGLLVPQMVVGWFAGRDRTIEREAGVGD
ncbi:CynX/NimT family MFS transporter [Streptomyces sp. NRRL F-5126]|uniref:CynX/NimT family MFS transporter n=1 Tax=Streptomyces sp. NRRL F-5126 TaxID=1463857 RepID=UPI000AD5A44E|nr:MFS transporter [Streptomyces sp. NRRL F-5126]